MKTTDRDRAQDELIRRNSERIARNEEAILRQTAALEKIRDHYYPQRSKWRRAGGFAAKVVCVIVAYAGFMETADWYWNTRKTQKMAEQCAAVAKRLFFQENDAAGAVRFLRKAAELDDGEAKYRIALAYMNGIATILDLFDLGRPMSEDERARVDAILAEALYLQEVAPDDPMPQVLAAQAHMLRGEKALADAAVEKAIAIAPDNVVVKTASCMLSYAAQDFPQFNARLAAAERVKPDFPLVVYWKGMKAAMVDKDLPLAGRVFDELLKRAPKLAVAHAMKGGTLMLSSPPDLAGARKEYELALKSNPSLKIAKQWMSEAYEREGNLILARMWLDRLLEQDGRHMLALVGRARINGRLGDREAAVADLTAAIALAPFRADLYLERAKLYEAAGNAAAAKGDRDTAAAISRQK